MQCQSCESFENGTDICQTLKPLIIALKLFGVYFDAEDSHCVRCERGAKDGLTTHKKGNVWHFFLCPPNRNSEGKSSYCSRCLFALRLCYSLLVLVVQLGNIVRMLYSMVDNSNFNFGLTYGFLLWDFYILGCVLCMWYSSGSKRHLRLFYTKWRQLSQEKATEELGLKPITCRRWRNRIMFVGCFNVLFNFGSFTAVLSLQEPTMVQTTIAPFSCTTWTIFIAVLVNGWNSATNNFLLVFVVFVNKLFCTQFKQLTDVLEAEVTKANGVIPNNLKTIRIYHSKLCGVFYNYNKFLNYYLPLVYLVTIANSCLTLYNVIVHPNWSLVTLLNVLWLLVSLAICGVLSLSLSSVHEMAHSPLDKLYDLRETENSWPSQVIQPPPKTPSHPQLQLFVSRLTDTTIGASVLGMFVVTKQALLTIAGAYITYFMLLLQFRP